MLKLSQTAFANSMAILTAAFYLLFYLINLIAPGLFRFPFNAQFLGDVASLLPKEFAAGNFIVALVLMVITAWIFGYLLSSSSHFRFVEKGHRRGENVYSALGQTAPGRYLIVFFVRKKTQQALIVSARDMTDSERRRYEKK